MAFSRLRYEAEKEREKKQVQQSNKGSQSDKERVETPAPSRTTSSDSVLRREAQKEREKKAVAQTPKVSADDLYNNAVNVALQVSRNATEPPANATPTELTTGRDPRDATFWDLTVNSFKQGYYNSAYGQESYKEMTGAENEKDYYESLLLGKDYQFETDKWWEKAISGAAGLIGQQARQWSDPRSLAAGTAAAGAVALAGQAGPQIALPEEIITVPGAFFAGMQAGSTATNYEIEAGLAYNEMIENGISEDTAKKIALAVGGVNAALEMVQMDELGKAFKILDNSNATKGVTKRLIDELKDRGIDVATETVQEVMQEGSTILGTQAASKLEKGEWAYNSDEVLGRLGDTALSSALSFGLMNAPAAGMNMAGIANTNKNLGKVGSEYQVAAEDVIAEGLTFNENSDAYKVATELRAKQEAGETITDAELGRAVTANQQAINNEQRIAEANRDPQETLEELAEETVAERNKTAQSEDVGQETSAQRASAPYNAMSVENPVRQAAIAESKNMERKLGYGQEGMKAFNDILETSNKTVDQVRQEFQTAYEAGKINLPREKVGMLDSVRETAYNAGRLDYIQTLKTDKVRAEGVTINSKAGFDPADMSTDNLPQGVKPAARPADVTDFQVKTVDTLAKKLGVNVRIVTGIKGNAEIRGNTVLISTDFNRKQAGQNRSIVFYAAHEIGMHRLIKLAPAEGRAFINAIIEDANANLPANMTTDTEQRQAEYAEQNVHLSVADAMEEVAADKIFGLYDSEEAFAEAIDRIVNGKDEKAKQGARKFKDILDDIVHKLKQVVAKLTGKEKAEAQQTLSEVEQLRDMWEKALEAGVNKAKNLQETKNAAQKSDVVQHSIDPSFAQQVLSWDRKSNKTFTLGETSDVLKSLGVRDTKIILRSGKANTILNDPKHSMTIETLARIPEVLEYPVSVLKSQQVTLDNKAHNDGNPSRLVIFGELTDTNGAPVAVVLELTPISNGKVMELGIIASAYGKTTHLSGFVQSSEVLYLDPNKKRTDNWLKSLGVQFPAGTTSYGSMGKVTYSNGKVNIQGVPFSQISGATYVAAPKQAPPMAEWQKKLADLHSKMTESEDDGSQKSLKVTDKKTLDFLNEQIDRGEYDPVKNPNGGYIKVYRSFQVIDGKLYAPMNAVDRDTDGKNHRLGYNSQYRVWEMATESPEIAQRYMDANPDAPYAKFDLDGVDNKTGGVAYNPYLHASNLVLNDQFSAAYRRNLITVECYVPVSEANGAYKAQYAKDATGWVEWKPGGVAGKLMKQKPEYTRKLFVSRYMLPVREVKAPELASMYKEYLDGTGIKVPWNVVTPELRRELVKAGVGIDYKDVYQSTDKKTGEKKYAKFDEVFPGERQYSLKDSDYMKAVESGDMETAQKMVDAAAAAAMPESKIKTENGDLRVVYHGTNTGDFNVFNPDYIGMSSGDDGFFGMGFYFAYSEGEASYYGAKRIIPAYLNLKNPFNFDRELQTYNGKKARSGYAPDAVALMNFANKFPDIANSITIGVVEKGDDEVKDLPLREFAKAFKDVIDNKTFEHQELTNEYGEKETLVVADPEVHEYEYNGVKHSYRGYGFQKRFWGEANDLDVAYEYLSNTVYSYVDMLSRTRLILDNNREFTAALKEMGYDGAIQSEYGDEAVAFYPHQIKSADPVTYDDNGNVIPLSQRFNEKNDDIRYSLKSQEDLMRQNAKLKEVNQELKAQFKTTKFAKVDKKALRQFAKQLLKDYQSGADIDETLDTLDSVFTYIANGENGETAVWEEAYKRAYDAAVSILSNSSTLNDELFQAYKQLRDDLKNTGITIDKKYDHDLIGYESINEFRKANYGRIKIVNDGTPVDMMYQELAWRYPEFFDEGTYSNQADQLSHIAEVLDSLQPTEVNPYSSNMRESATWLANDIMERYFELPQAKPTFADKAQQKLTKQVIKDHEKMERLREQKNERIASLIEERRAKVKKVTQKERQKRDEKVREIKDRFKAKEAKMSENKKASILRERIIRHTQGMSHKLLHPTDKQHVPENLRKPVAAVLDAINLESQYTVDPVTGKRHKGGDGDPTKRTKAFQELRKAYQDIIKDDSADIVVDPAIEAMLDLVVELQDVKLADMNLRQLQTVWDVVRVVEHTINTAGELLSETKYKRTVEWASAMVNDTATRRSKRGGKAGAIRIDMENPYTFFSHYGESGKAVFRMLRDAQDKQQTMVEEVRKKVRSIVDPKTVRKLEKETAVFTTERGDKLTLTTAQIMDIYLLTKRQQAHDHLLKGGIVQPEVKSKNIKRGTDAILLSAADLSEIVGTLDSNQREIANKLQEMTRTTLADYGNEASMKAYGYKKFTGNDYWPIKSAREGVHSNVEKGGNNTRSIKNIGLAKSVMPHANNPLDIGGVFQTFASHAADMTDYAAWLCPMEDANRLFNFQFRDDLGQRTGKTIKGLLDRVGGKGAQQYWHNLMEDIQNGIKSQADNTMIKPINKIIGNVRGASVGANIRVIVQQPTAILRAAAVLNPLDMTKGLAAGGGWKKAVQHSPIAQRKNMGGFDISSPAQMNEILYDSQTPLQRFNNAMMWGAGKADAITWGRIWNACEWAVKRDRKDLTPRSDEFYEAVNELFTEVVDQSQVVDGVLQRSQLMRSNNALLNQATAFMGEPTMTMNMMLRAYDGLVNETDKSKRGKAIKTFGRTAMVLLVTNAVNAVMQSLVDAWRDDEDDEYWNKLKNAFFCVTGEEETAWEKATAAVLGGNLGSSLNPAGYVPFAKDILSILQGYNVTRADADVMGDIINATTTFIESVGGDGKRTIAYATKNLAQQVGKVFGISAPNILRDVWGIVRTIALETGNIPLQYEMEKAIYKIDNDGNTGLFVDILYKAYTTDKETYQHIYDDMKASGFNMDKIQTQMESRMKKEQGVTKVENLEQRYLHPDEQRAYDSKLKSVSNSSLWRSASAKQKEDVEAQLYNLSVMNSDGEKLQEKIDEGKPYGLTETEYLLYDLALSMVDQPNKSGEMGGTPTNAEKAAAIAKVGGFGNGEIAYLWDTEAGYEVYAAGLDMRTYVERLGSGDSVNVEKLIEADGVVGEDNYYDFLDMLNEYDQPTESGKLGTFTQDEATAAISAMPGLTNSQRAWLWQSVNKGWKEKNNPWK